MKNRSKGFTLIELMVVVAIVALLSAIATVRFARSQARSKQAEASTNLKAMFAEQKAFAAEKGRFTDSVGQIGFSPERNNRYTYFVGASVNLTDRTAAAEVPTPPGGVDTGVMYDAFKYNDPVVFVPATLNTVPAVICAGGTVAGLGVVGTTSIWTGAAQGQIDTDTATDNWSISTDNRTLSGTCDAAGPNPAGEPANEHNDVEQSI